MANDMVALYERLASSRAERFKFLGDSVKYLESLGVSVDDFTLQGACMESEERVLGNAKIGVAKGLGSVAGVLLI